jgi:hypothetical protein
MVANAGKIAHTTATDQDDAMLLKVMAFTGNIGNDFALVGQTNLGNLTKRRVRLFRSRCINAGTNAALLWVLFHCWNLGLRFLRSPALADQLVNRWHIFTLNKAVTLDGQPFFAVEAQPLAHPADHTMCCYVDFRKVSSREESLQPNCGSAPLAGDGGLVKWGRREVFFNLTWL